MTHSVRADAGIVYPDNGVKFFNKEGFKLSDELELAIENQVDQPMKTVPADRLGKVERMSEAHGRYIEFCKNTFPSNLTLKGLKIVVDCANGAAYAVAPAIFHELGSEVVAIADNPDGFNINQTCGATDTTYLQEIVFKYNADVGIAFDGDGDRLIMVDHYGMKVDGDELLCIIAIYRFHLKESVLLGVVGTVMSNLGLEQTLKRHHIAFERSAVGDRYVLDLMQQKGLFLGGESSGHIVDLRYTTTGDGIITALQILRIMQQTGKPLAELKKVMIKRPQVLINIVGLSGGVDSAVTAMLVHKAVGNQLDCVLVDTGILRLNETDEILNIVQKDLGIEIICINAKDRFIKALKGVFDPEEKRRITGEQFIRVFESEAKKLTAKWLGQGTIYPDVIESAKTKMGKRSVIKTHHNVGGLPLKMKLKLIEPLRELFKDEVRKLGLELGLPYDLIYRHPFPGPGLAIRVLGEVNAEYVNILQRADSIFIEELKKSDYYYQLPIITKDVRDI